MRWRREECPLLARYLIHRDGENDWGEWGRGGRAMEMYILEFFGVLEI